MLARRMEERGAAKADRRRSLKADMVLREREGWLVQVRTSRRPEDALGVCCCLADGVVVGFEVSWVRNRNQESSCSLCTRSKEPRAVAEKSREESDDEADSRSSETMKARRRRRRAVLAVRRRPAVGVLPVSSVPTPIDPRRREWAFLDPASPSPAPPRRRGSLPAVLLDHLQHTLERFVGFITVAPSVKNSRAVAAKLQSQSVSFRALALPRRCLT